MAGTGGRREGAGRPRGTPNKVSADLRAMILGALNSVGGERWLARQAEQNPTAFMSLLGRILPTTVANADGSPLAMHLLAAKLVSDEIIQRQLERGEVQPTIDGHAEAGDGQASHTVVDFSAAPLE
jgi:hypothetical protein